MFSRIFASLFLLLPIHQTAFGLVPTTILNGLLQQRDLLISTKIYLVSQNHKAVFSLPIPTSQDPKGRTAAGGWLQQSENSQDIAVESVDSITGKTYFNELPKVTVFPGQIGPDYDEREYSRARLLRIGETEFRLETKTLDLGRATKNRVAEPRSEQFDLEFVSGNWQDYEDGKDVVLRISEKGRVQYLKSLNDPLSKEVKVEEIRMSGKIQLIEPETVPGEPASKAGTVEANKSKGTITFYALPLRIEFDLNGAVVR